MKFEIIDCPQCGEAFKRTNPRKEYCSGACRVAAHRDRHGYMMPIFDKEQVQLIEEVLRIPSLAFESLVEDAIKFRTIHEKYQKAVARENEEGIQYYSKIIMDMNMADDENPYEYVKARTTARFAHPIKELLKYAEEKPITCQKKANP